LLIKNHTLKTLSLFLLSFTLLASSCKKQPVDQLSLLPSATQTGANTFGCLVNGLAFTPGGKGLIDGPVLSCKYGLYANGYFFNLNASRKDHSGNFTAVSIQTDSLKISEGETVPLTRFLLPGYACGFYLGSLSDHITNDCARGQLMITHLDTINRIVSGTFHFNAVSTSGDTLKITNGRFDMHYNF
jgi:hypothetical protein